MWKKIFVMLCLSLPAFWLSRIPRAAGVFEGYGGHSQIGTVTESTLSEISGITPSRAVKGLWWAHNDSGDQARIYLINAGGRLLGRYGVTGARHRDWEDIGGYTGKDGKHTLYIADFGDNGLKRDDLTLYLVKEPGFPGGAPKTLQNGVTEPAEALPFRYPDGKHDAEALFIDPQSGRPYIVIKTMSPPGGIYRFPLPLRPGKIVTLEKMKGAAVDHISKLLLVTGAAAAPDGSRVVIRTYFSAFEIKKAGSGAFEKIFSSMPESIKLPMERQGEAISYTLDGKSLVTTSEKIPAPIFQLTRQR
jgi:hypothetical protein